MIKTREYKEIELTSLRDNLETGELRIGDRIGVIGTYTEYVPFAKFTQLVESSSKKQFALQLEGMPCKVGSVNGVYCGAILKEGTDGIPAGDSCIPIFYSERFSKKSIKMIEHFTGDMVEIEGHVAPLPEVWKRLLVSNDYYLFDRGDGIEIPFCIKVDKCEPYGLQDKFFVDMWTASHFEGTMMPLTGMEHVLCESLIPSRMLMENPFPGAFLFAYQRINIRNTEQTQGAEYNLNEVTKAFPKLLFNFKSCTDDKTFLNLLKNKTKIEFQVDLAHNKFSKGASTSVSSTKDIVSANAFYKSPSTHTQASEMMKDWGKLINELYRDAKSFPKMLGSPIVSAILHMRDDDLFEKELEKSAQEEFSDFERRLVLFRGMRRIIGRLVWAHGKGKVEDGFTINDLQKYEKTVGSPEVVNKLIIFMKKHRFLLDKLIPKARAQQEQ